MSKCNMTSESASNPDFRLTRTIDNEEWVNYNFHCEAIKKLSKQLEEARKHLTESVSRECKCEVNISVNNDLVNRNLELKQQIKEANNKLYLIANTATDIYSFAPAQGFRESAKEYLTKYKIKD